MQKTLLTLTALSACLVSFGAMAESTAPAGPFKAGDFMVRARVLDVIPHENSRVSIGGDVNISNSMTPEIDLSYFLTPNISVEAIAAVTKHDVNHSSGTDAGSAWLLPPTVTLQYHFDEWYERITLCRRRRELHAFL